MKRSWLIVALLLSVGVNIGIFAMIGLARSKEPRPWSERMERSGPPLERLADRLGLEGDGRGAFLRQQREFFESSQRIRHELERVREQLRMAVGSEAPDRAEIADLLEHSARLNAEMENLFIDNVLRTRELLDRRQERLYFSMLERMRRAGDRWGGGERRR